MTKKHYLNSILRKFTATLIAAVLLLSLMPALTAQANDQPPAGFTAIRTAEELDTLVRGNLSGSFWLANDIDLSAYPFKTGTNATWTSSGGWESIGTVTSGFTGVFDGNGKTISGLWSSGRGSNQGLFALIGQNTSVTAGGGTVKDLTIELDAKGITGSGERKGGFAANIYGAATVVENVHVKGVANAARTDGAAPGGTPITGGANYIAGFAGAVQRATVKNSSASNVSLSGASYVAGFTGVGYVGAKIDGCSVTNVRIESSSTDYGAPGSYAAGFVGGLYSYEGTKVTNSSVNGAVVNARGSYPGGFVGALYDGAKVEGAKVSNARVTTTGHYAGGFVGAIYNRAEASDIEVTNVVVSTGVYNAGGFASAIYNSAQVSNVIVDNATVTSGTTNSDRNTTGIHAGGFAAVIYDSARVTGAYVVDSTVHSNAYGAGGFVAAVYNTARISQSGVSQSTVSARTTNASGLTGINVGGFAGLAYNNVVITENFVENTNVTGTYNVGGFVGHLYDSARFNDNYANAWTRPEPYGDNYTPGPRPGLSVWKDSAGNMIPAVVTSTTNGTNRSAGGFAGQHTAIVSGNGILNAYTSVPVRNVESANRGAFTGRNALATARYRNTNYFDDLSSNSVNSPNPFPGGTNPIRTYVGFSTVSQSNWRGDSLSLTGSALSNGGSFPQARITDRMVLQVTFVGWVFAADNGPWHIEEGVSYPYFLFGRGAVGFDSDWERLRRAVSLGPDDLTENFTIVIYPFGTPASVAVENLVEGILVIRDEHVRSAASDNYFINSNGDAISVGRSVTLKSSDGNNVLLYTRSADDGRHFNVEGRNDITFAFDKVIIDGCNAAGGITVDFATTSTLTLTGVAIRNCVTSGNGGGVWLSESSRLTLTSGTISNNKAEEGGGVYSFGNFDMTGGTISGNSAISGGGVLNLGTLTIRGSAGINDNSATNGGGVWSLGAFNIRGGTINGNTATGNGGAILTSGRITMIGGTISGNKASGNGAGMWSSGILVMAAGNITGNAATRDGGGIWNSGDLTKTGGVIGGTGSNDNAARANGGGNIWNSGRLDISRDNGTIGVNYSGIVNLGTIVAG